MVGNSILVIMYDTQACMSGLVMLLVNKSLLMRRYSNRISLSDILGESAFSLNLRLNQECGERPRIDISLMICDCFFVSFQATIGTDAPVFMSG